MIDRAKLQAFSESLCRSRVQSEISAGEQILEMLARIDLLEAAATEHCRGCLGHTVELTVDAISIIALDCHVVVVMSPEDASKLRPADIFMLASLTVDPPKPYRVISFLPPATDLNGVFKDCAVVCVDVPS